MKLVTLMENTTCRDDLVCEHGLSLYIETGSHRILFDAGQTDAFLHNAQRMGIDLAQVDLCILSHGHYDHGGGLQRFLEINDHAPVYLSRYAFGAHYNAANKYIGLSPALQGHPRLILTGDEHLIDAHLSLHSCRMHPQPFPFSPFGLNREEDGVRLPEDFRHEQYLLIREGDRRILVSGCSHRGVLNIRSWFDPDVLIGGFHLMKLDPASDAAQLQHIADQLLQGHTVYYTGHCTGEGPYACLKAHMGDRLHALSTGMTLTI